MSKGNSIYENRKYVIGGIAVLVVFIYIIRLFCLQILNDDYKRYADSNAFLKRVQYPARGNMFDRNGNLLVYNQSSYDVTVIPREMADIDTVDLCRTLGITREYFEKRMTDMRDRRKNPGYSPYTHQLLIAQLTPEETGMFQEKLFKFPGFYIQRRSIRQYTDNIAALALGDIGEISQKELDNDTTGYYQMGDYVGKQGVEKYYEELLRGRKGVEILLRDARGRIQGRYMNGLHDVPSVPGKNLTLGIDAALQSLAERLMSGKRGSIVAIEPATGEILCLVSAPSFDPAMLVGRDRGKNHLKLLRNPAKPLLNRAIVGTYPPGSTFKTAQGLIFMQEEIVDEHTVYPCYNGFVIPGFRLRCHSHPSPIALQDAISTSCNSYFCWGLWRMIDNKKYETPQNAITVWKNHMVDMGFGYALGIDLPGEKRGLIPNAEFYNKMHNGRWRGLSIISIAIGQGEILTTPIQIANLAATIGNRGRFITPHMVKSIQDTVMDEKYRTWRYTGIDREYYDIIAKGMRGAVVGSNYGATCRRANVPGLEICGKTGTAQNRGEDHSIFMGFSPMDSPEIAVSVVVENGGFGATWAVPIGALIIEQYLNGCIAEERLPEVERISRTNLLSPKENLYEMQLEKENSAKDIK